MDEQYEIPTVTAQEIGTGASNGDLDADVDSSGDEDIPDWTKFPSTGKSSTILRPIIPKRGDKDFEPAPDGPTGLQSYALDRSRNAMLDALRPERGISSKSVTYGVWLPSSARVEVLHARGNHFNTMGHSSVSPLSSSFPSSHPPSTKKLHLLPEEALYLIERGSMFCWKREDTLQDDLDFSDDPDEGGPRGTPVSVQQAFAEMIGRENLTLEKYQVYAYLKRLGYTVSRARPPPSSPLYPTPAHRASPPLLPRLWDRICAWAGNWRKRIGRLGINWWRPFRFVSWYKHTTYPSVFSALRIIPSGHSIPLRQLHTTVRKNETPPPSPYTVFYNIWKPSTPWRKTAVPPPDFEIIVVNANTTPLPTLSELTSVFAALPRLPPPVPRRRHNPTKPPPAPPKLAPSPITLLDRIKIFFGLMPRPKGTGGKGKPGLNPFVMLKAGNKSVVIAAVDGGAISFVRFAEGCFENWPAV